MGSEAFVPPDFDPPRSLTTDRFVLEPLGPQHNEADHAAWTSSIDHIRATPGYPDGDWPPAEGMSLEENLADLTRHAADFEAGRGFTFTVLDPGGDRVIGCVYLYPPRGEREGDVVVQSWVRADRAELDAELADAVAAWLGAEWPWQRPNRCGRQAGPTGQ
jgi:RimJ/RimL family protein N-acetyltransferase